SQVLQAAIQHTDASIGKIVAALYNTKDPQTGGSLWNTTDLVLTAKHGQDPRVGEGGLMADSTLPTLLNNAGDTVAQATQDNVSLIGHEHQPKPADAVKQLQNLVNTGSINVYFRGQAVNPVSTPAGQIIDQILSGPQLVQAGFGDPAKDSTTPDIIVT